VGALLLITGCGLGTVLPITTVSVQNAVLPWQLGTVTGVINFVRALASALMVALYGAFLFGAEKGVTLETIAARNGAALAKATSAGYSPRRRSASRSRGCFCWRWKSVRCARARGKGTQWRFRRSRELQFHRIRSLPTLIAEAR